MGGEVEAIERRSKYAVLLCAEDSDYIKKVYGGYFKVFVALLGEEDETWHLFHAAKGDLPRGDDVIDGYDGFVITGSCSDAHGDDQWIRDLVLLLKKLDAKQKKVLGICFGHQILSRALGGKTGRATKGWDIGVTCIHPSHSTSRLLASLGIPSHLPVIECHRDEVWEVPPLAEVMAQSEKTGVEMFRYGDHIMGIQGHPEYNKDILLHLIDRLLQRNLIQVLYCTHRRLKCMRLVQMWGQRKKCHAEAAKAKLDAREPDREAWKRLCKGFLKGDLLL